MTERIPRLVESDLDEEQLAVYRSITQGPRASGTQAFPLTDEAGALHGPFGVMLHAPRLGLRLQDLGSAIRYETTLTARAREIAILKVAVATSSEFEWYAHERVGRLVGLTEDELLAMRSSDFHGEDPQERAVSKLCDLLLHGVSVDQDAFDGFARDLDTQLVIEVVVLVGYYRTLAQLMDVFDIAAPTD